MKKPSSRNPLDVLAEEFVTRRRNGETPSVEEFTARHPELADEIRELWPLLDMVDGLVPSVANVSEDRSGTKVGDYRLLRVLARGGMGVVYEAEQESLGRRVAVKILSQLRSAQNARVTRFLREARVTAQLHHTNIVPVIGYGRLGTDCYYVMQLIQGHSLDVVLRSLRKAYGESSARTPSWPSSAADLSCQSVDHFSDERGNQNHRSESTAPSQTNGDCDASDVIVRPRDRRSYVHRVAEICAAVADALACAHAHGVLHRDIKPSNLMLDRSGHVWVTDFGLAKADDDLHLTRTREQIGTPRYMAPECFSGICDARSDICSLGLTMYELLCLKPAYQQSSVATLAAAISNRPQPIRKQRPDIPRDLAVIVDKCIERDPRDRYQSAKEVSDDLRRFLGNEPICARRLSLPYRLNRWCRRNPLVAVLSVCLLTILLGVSIASVAVAINMRALASTVQRERDNALRREFRAHVQSALATAGSRVPGQRVDTFEYVRQAMSLSDRVPIRVADRRLLRKAVATAAAYPDVTFKSSNVYEGLDDCYPSFSQDLSVYGCVQLVDGERTITIRRSSDQELLSTHATKTNGWCFQLSPDGSMFCDGLGVYDSISGAPIITNLETNKARQLIAFSPDSRWFACAKRQDGDKMVFKRINVFHLPDGELRYDVTCTGDLQELSLSPDGQHLVYAAMAPDEPTTYDLHIVDFRRNVDVATMVVRSERQRAIVTSAWHPTDHVVSFNVWNRICSWKWERDDEYWIDAHSDLIRRLDYHPSGLLASSTSVTNGHTGLWEPLSGRHLLWIDGICRGFRIDGSEMAIWNQPALEFYDVHAKEIAYVGLETAEENEQGTSVAVDPLNRCLVRTSQNGIFFWDLQQHRLAASVKNSFCDGAVFSPDSRTIWLLAFSDGRYCLFRSTIRIDINDDIERWEFGQLEQVAGFDNRAEFLAVTSDGKTISCFETARGVHHVFNVATGEAEQRQVGPYTLATLDPKGQWVARRDAQNVFLHSINPPGRTYHFPLTGAGYAFGRQTNRVFLVSHRDQKALSIVDTENGQEISARSRSQLQVNESVIAASNDGKLIAVNAGSPPSILLLDAESGKERIALSTKESLWILRPHAFTPDGSRLLVSRNMIDVGVWNLALVRKCLRTFGLDWNHEPLPDAQPWELRPIRIDLHPSWRERLSLRYP